MPTRSATLEVYTDAGTCERKVPVDMEPYYLLGRASDQVSIPLDSPSCSRVHAALVHHNDGRIFVIDLQSTHGTVVDGRSIPPNKPVQVKDQSQIKFGQLEKHFVLRCETSAVKRQAEDQAEAGRPKLAATEERRAAPLRMRASHLLIKHRGSRRASSWKEPVVTRSLEEAMAEVGALRARLVAGEVDFATLAAQESHCSSAKRGGDLGEFGPGQMQKAFEDAVLALAVGALSGPVVSDSGVHIILRTG